MSSSFPGVSAVVLLFTIAFWAIAIGVVEIVVGISRGNFLTVVIGVISILFGLLLLSNPLAGALAYIWVVGGIGDRARHPADRAGFQAHCRPPSGELAGFAGAWYEVAPALAQLPRRQL